MKKIIILLSFILCTLFTFTQTNLLENPSFETWGTVKPNIGKPVGWTFKLPSLSPSPLAQDSDVVKDGDVALRIISPSAKTVVTQLVDVIPGEIYTLVINYYIVSKKSDRIASLSSGFKRGIYHSSPIMKDYADEINNNKDFPEVFGEWVRYQVIMIAPVDAKTFSFEFNNFWSCYCDLGQYVFW